MKRIILSTFLLFSSVCVYGSRQIIVCDNNPGEIYFVGLHPRLWGASALYHSTDYGENIQLIDTTEHYGFYGMLIADALDSALHRVAMIPTETQYYSNNGGSNWEIVNNEASQAYASGVVAGEIYRRIILNSHNLERSVNNGVSYQYCSCYNFPDSLWIFSAALGIDPGEVYLYGNSGNLYYSNDYAENFEFKGDLESNWGVSPWSYLINGAEIGEVYFLQPEWQTIWRAVHFGDSAEVIADFSFDSFTSGIASSDSPGELYFLANENDITPGGTINILHSTDYGENWTSFEHVIEWEDVPGHSSTLKPKDNPVKVWPNPANASYNISYELNSVMDVQIQLYNLLGQKLWHHHMGLQNPSNYQITLTNEKLPSGTYFLQLKTGQSIYTRTITIVK